MGDYLEADGEKQHEFLFEAHNLTITRGGRRVRWEPGSATQVETGRARVTGPPPAGLQAPPHNVRQH